MTQFTNIGPFRYHIPDSAPFYETRMSLLWLAEALDANHRPMGEKVVLKVARLKEEQFSLANQRAIDNEERWLRRLNHPGIVKLRPIAQDGVTRADQAIYRARSTLPGNPWFVVTDYLPGGTLQSLVEERKKLSTGLALQIARSLAGALAHCHAKGCVHRDFKPQNVLFAEKPPAQQLTAKSQPILIDFGIANEQGEQQFVAGSKLWLSPETVLAANQGVKLLAAPAMDIYALGLVFYYMLTGKRPPDTADPATQLKIGSSTLVDIAARRRPLLAQGINQLIARLLAQHPARRLTAQQVVNEIDHLWGYVASSPLEQVREPWVWMSGAVAAGLLAGAVIYNQFNSPVSIPTPSPATAVQEAAAPIAGADGPSPTPSGLVALAPTATAPLELNASQAPTATVTLVALTVTATAATGTATATAIPVAAVATNTVGVTIAASPTLYPTSTPAPTLTAPPVPSPTTTPPAIPTGVTRRLPTRTPTLVANPRLTLIEPLTGDLGGKQTFRWTTDVVLKNNQAFELIIWAVGQDPLTKGFGPFGNGAATSVTGDLDIFARETGGQYLIRDREYEWGVRLVQIRPFRALQYLGGGHRFRYKEASSESN